jgi:hypothetical protein
MVTKFRTRQGYRVTKGSAVALARIYVAASLPGGLFAGSTLELLYARSIHRS